jgi:O-antigen/teichoic acid export membrane protein
VSKAAEMAKVSARGGFHLFWGLAVSAVISAVGVIVFARVLGPTGLGLYTIALTAPNLIATFRDWGINSAMIKYTAQYRGENKPANIKNILVAGLVFETSLGLALSVLSFSLSGFLATTVFHRPTIALLIQVASFTILTGALMTAAQAVFTGMEKMVPNSITIVCQSIIKTVLVPALVILGFGVHGAVVGATVATLIAGLIGVLLMWTIYRNLPKPNNGEYKLSLAENVKFMFKYGLPLSISSILSGFLTQFYNFLIVIYASDLLIGNYSVANKFVVLITFFVTPITTMLFPAFSKLDPQKEKETLQNVFQYSVKYAALLVVPTATAIIVLAQPAVFTLFGDNYAQAPLFLALLAIGYLYVAFGNLSLGNLINGQGETRLYLKLTLINVATGLALSLILIPRFGIPGLIATTLTAGIPGLITGLFWVRRHYTVTVDWASSAKILLSSAIAAGATYALLLQLNFSSWINLIIGLAAFLLVFLLSIVLTRAINQSDINNLREMTRELKPIQPPINLILNIIEKLMTALHQ